MTTVGKKQLPDAAPERISVAQLLQMIEDNKGSEGLDLSGKDLSGLRLSPKTLEQYRPAKGTPPWLWQPTGGLCLEGANLGWSILSEADLSYGNLRNANLCGAQLRYADLIDADLRGAVLWDANLDDAVLSGARLEGVNLFGANLRGTTLDRELLGDSIVQESPAYTDPPEANMEPDRDRFWQASHIYRTLKSSFDNNARYGDASWAYRKARRMEKHLAWQQARRCWGNGERTKALKLLGKRVTDEIAEKLCDYGENWVYVLVWLAGVWLGFALIYGISGNVLYTSDAGATYMTRRLGDMLAFSLATMTTLGAVGLEPRNVEMMRFLMPIEVLLGIALTGLLGFVLGNRINRV